MFNYSFIDRLVKRADNSTLTSTSGYASCSGFGDSILHSIEVGTNNHYYACTEPGKPRRIEVWLHLNRPLVLGECAEFDTIIENNDIPDYDILCNGKYDYHLSYFSKAWLEDIFPKLVSTKMINSVIGSQQPIDQLIETAIESGCHILDMKTMEII